MKSLRREIFDSEPFYDPLVGDDFSVPMTARESDQLDLFEFATEEASKE